MKNKAKTLFIFEGGKTEDKFVEKLEANFLGERHAIKCVYDAEIYQLYKTIKAEDGFFDIVSLLKDRKAENAEALKEYERDSFAYIYLFFDYDAHSTMADDYKIEEMLTFFNDETENGLLYISYPMVEATYDFVVGACTPFTECYMPVEKFGEYKTVSGTGNPVASWHFNYNEWSEAIKVFVLRIQCFFDQGMRFTRLRG